MPVKAVLARADVHGGTAAVLGPERVVKATRVPGAARRDCRATGEFNQSIRSGIAGELGRHREHRCGREKHEKKRWELEREHVGQFLGDLRAIVVDAFIQLYQL